MNKLEMAHEYAMLILGFGKKESLQNLVSESFDYADAMQAEADKRIDKSLPDVLNMADSPQLEWQPDWSQAPNSLVQYFAVDESGRGGWYVTEPELCSDHWYWSDFGERLPSYDHACDFGYTGNWKDSLRKRPE